MLEQMRQGPLPAKGVESPRAGVVAPLYFLILCVALCYLFSPVPSQAQLSPGELAAPHEALEGLTNCTECHELGKGPSAEKCLKCHTAVDAAIQSERGYHYRVVAKEKKACFSCHSDHSGRKFQLIHWEDEMKEFNHQMTDFALSGKHQQSACRDCHQPDLLQNDFLKQHQQVNFSATFLGLTESCLGCHRDEHREQLGADCKKCHDTNHWSPAREFDHDNTQFVLFGKHTDAQCQKCHPTLHNDIVISPQGKPDSSYAKFTGLHFNNCTPCHTDPHAGKLGADCQQCHSQNAWSPASGFDHASTRFPLTGKHKSSKCKNCHKNIATRAVASSANQRSTDVFAAYKGLDFNTCESCHQDVHNAKLGPDCQSCHKTNAWNSLKQGSFDHSRTDYTLLGKHQDVKCQACHKGGVKDAKKLKSDFCADCHTDSHNGQFARRKDGGVCESCHTESGFRPSQFTIKRHTEESSFKLTGAHLAQPCPICHVTQKSSQSKQVMRFTFEDTNCIACHTDIHLGQFANSSPKQTCVSCHVTDSWYDLIFDHNRDASYKLEGAHAHTLCGNCHKTERKGKKSSGKIPFVRYRPLDSACKNCHSLETLEVLGKL
jgi:hypothetical protein